MCSIIGYCGSREAAPILVKGLKRMEYRGYDSAGVATENENEIQVRKGTGRVSDVNSNVKLDDLSGKSGIGHTRWATHGKVTDLNAHPHTSNSGKIAIVHNGTIENFEELKRHLESEGYSFKSETDSEVIANLLQKNYETTKDVTKTLRKTVSELQGHYAFVAMFENGQLAAARSREPLIIGVGRDDLFLSSDVLGFIEYTDEAIYVKNKNFVILEKGKFKIFNYDGKHVEGKPTKVSKEFGDVYKDHYAYFTLKEIHEQPETILKAGEKALDEIKSASDYIRDAKNIYITGSGTSYNAALIAKQILSKYAKIKAEPIMASELQFSPDIIEKNSVLISISQSGETADVLDAVKIAKEANCKIIAIVNPLTSSLAREADVTIGMNCGPEIGVVATKSFTSQLVILYKIAQKLNGGNLEIDFRQTSESISKILKDSKNIQQTAGKLKGISDIYVLGSGIHWPIAIEASLKLKELTYIHAEGIPSGELKHGPLALIDDNVFVIIINPNDPTYEGTLTSARKIKSRSGAKIIGISDVKSDLYDYRIEIPKMSESQFPILEIIPIQLLSYYIAREKDTDPDYPRNLAKSITVK